MENEQWHLDRLNGIGGSEASVILGLNPWESRLELWHEKVERKIPIVNDNNNIRLNLGKVLEPLIAEEYTRKTGRKLVSKPQKTHDNYPFINGNIDREIVKSEKDSPGILEIKTKGAFIDWENEEIPPYYTAQLQHYLAVYGYTWGSFAVLDFNSFEVNVTDIERDNKFIENLINEEKKFWKLVTDKTPPEPQPTKSCEDFLREYFNQSEPITIDISDNIEATKYAKKLNHIKEHKKQLEESETECKTYFMNLIQNAEKAIGDGYTISWKNDKDSTKFNTDRFKLENPELYKKYLEPKKGARRFLTKFQKDI